jgi:phenylalanine-4-hydroxylase
LTAAAHSKQRNVSERKLCNRLPSFSIKGEIIEVTTRSEYIDGLEEVKLALENLADKNKVNRILIENKSKTTDGVRQIREVKKQVKILHEIIFDGTNEPVIKWSGI